MVPTPSAEVRTTPTVVPATVSATSTPLTGAPLASSTARTVSVSAVDPHVDSAAGALFPFAVNPNVNARTAVENKTGADACATAPEVVSVTVALTCVGTTAVAASQVSHALSGEPEISVTAHPGEAEDHTAVCA